MNRKLQCEEMHEKIGEMLRGTEAGGATASMNCDGVISAV